MNSANGFNNLLWFIGIVEDNADPTNEGRVSVRCFGIHPPADSDEVQKKDLPWAVPINGSYGASSQIPKISDWVFGFFIDGRDAQHPMLLGMIPGQNMQLFGGSGSSDPYTAPSKEAAEEYGKPTLHPAQGGEDLETTQLMVQNAIGGDGPGVPSGSSPQKNVVWKSRYGDSYMQIDGGDNAEFMLLSHESGSHILIDQLGNIKIKSFSDMFMSSEGTSYDKSNGSRSVEIEGEYKIKSKNATIEVSGDLNHMVKGNYNLNVGGKIGIVAGHGFEVAAQRVAIEAVSEHINLKSAEKFKVQAGGVSSIKSGGEMFITAGGTIDVSGAGVVSMSSSGGALNLTASADVAVDGANIHLNSGNSSAATPSSQDVVSPQLDEPIEQELSSGTNESNLGGIGGIASTAGGGAGDIDDNDEANTTKTTQTTILRSTL
jgi:hypothetical protein